MLKLLIEKELREIVGSSKFAVSFGVCSILVLLAFFIGAKNYEASLAQYQAAKSKNLQQLEGLTDWLEVRDFRVYLPPQPLAVLVSGISNDIGRTTAMSGRGELPARDSRYGEEPMYAVFRFLDLEFVFQIVLSLFAVVFSYDAVNGEKERGTLQLTFANAIPRAQYIFGKCIGSYIALTIPLLIPLALGCLLLPILGIGLTFEEWMRLALIILTGIAYIGTFLTITILFSSLTQRTSSSFLMALVVWILSVVIIPRGAVLLAGRAVDVPTIEQMNALKAKLNSQLWNEDRKAMSQYKPGSNADLQKMVSEFQRFMEDLSEKRDAKMKQLTERLEEQRTNAQRTQRMVAFGIARISPAAAFNLAVSELAGTSLSLQQRYKDATLAYQQVYGKFLYEKTGMKPGSGMFVVRESTDPGEKKLIRPDELPVFEFSTTSLTDSVTSAMIDFGLLLFYTIVCFAGAFLVFLRFDVR